MLRKLVLLLVFTLVSLFSVTQAACPVTHAALTKKFWNYFPQYDNKQKSEFMVGTLFPDIRYLAEIPRSVTHIDNVTLEDVLNAPTPFQAGLLFHSYVDQQREIFVVNSGLYDYLAPMNAPKPATQIKLVEDELLFSTADWKSCRNCLKKILEEERGFGIKEVDLQKWHLLLDYCFSYTTSTILWYLSTMDIGVMDVTIDEMASTYELHKTLSKDPILANHVDKLLEHFDALFKEAVGSLN